MKYKPADRLTLGWQRQAGVGSLALGKSKEIWKCKNNQNQHFPLASNPHLKRPRTHLWGINPVSCLLSTNRTLPSLEKEKRSWIFKISWTSQKVTCPALLGRLLLEAEHGAGNLTLIWQISLDFTQECAHTRLSRLPKPKTQWIHVYHLLSFFPIAKIGLLYSSISRGLIFLF